MNEIEGYLVRHPDWSLLDGGKPTDLGLREFMELASNLIDPTKKIIVIKTMCPKTKIPVPRTGIPAEEFSRRQNLPPPLPLSEFGPLITTDYPSIFNGHFFEKLQKSTIANRVALNLWGRGKIPLFAESPADVYYRVRKGIDKLRLLKNNGSEEDVRIIAVVHRETIIFSRIIFERLSLTQSLKMEVPYLGTYYFRL